MSATIRVSTELRDRLVAQAAEHGLTLGEHLAVLADGADRAARIARVRDQMAWTPREPGGDGPPAEDFSDWPGYSAP